MKMRINTVKLEERREAHAKEQIKEIKKYHSIFNNYHRYDLYNTIFSMIGLVTSVINYEIDIDKGNFVAYN